MKAIVKGKGDERGTPRLRMVQFWDTRWTRRKHIGTKYEVREWEFPGELKEELCEAGIKVKFIWCEKVS